MLRYAITSGEHDPRSPQPLLDQVRRLALNGVDFLQLREKHLEPGALANLVREILTILAASGSTTRLLINDRADIALATRAHGVHLTSGHATLTPAQIRTLYRTHGLPDPIVSKACHTLAEIESAGQPDLVLFSPVFGKANQPAAGLQSLSRACAQPIPVLALGGVTPENTPSCHDAGAAGVAGIRLFGISVHGSPFSVPH